MIMIPGNTFRQIPCLQNLITSFIIFCILTTMLSCQKESSQNPDTIYSFTNDTLVTQQTTFYKSDPDVPVSCVYFQYNSLGRLIKSTFGLFVSGNSHFEIRSFDSLEYNANNQLIKSISLEYKTQTLTWDTTKIETHEYSNDSVENCIYFLSQTSYTNRIVITRRNGLEVKTEYYNDVYLNQTKTYFYNSDKKLKTVKYYNNSNELYMTQDYTYFSDQIIIIDRNKENQITRYTTQNYKYNKLTTINIIDLTSSISQQILRYEYDSFGRLVKEFKTPVQYPYMSMIALPKIVVYQYN